MHKDDLEHIRTYGDNDSHDHCAICTTLTYIGDLIFVRLRKDQADLICHDCFYHINNPDSNITKLEKDDREEFEDAYS